MFSNGFLLAAVVLGVLGASPAEGATLHIVCDERPQMEVLKEWLQAQGHQVTIFDQTDFATTTRSRPAALFMYVHGPLDQTVGERLIEYTRSGGRLIVLHHGIASAKAKSLFWMEFVGVSILPTNAPEYPWAVLSGVDFEMVNLAPGHHITTRRMNYTGGTSYARGDPPESERNLPAFVIRDTEAYLNLRLTPGRRRTLLFRMKCRDPIGGNVYQQDTGAWMMPSGKGWILYFQPGHHGRDFQVPQFRQVLLNTIDWKP